jgi:hypothetical protein
MIANYATHTLTLIKKANQLLYKFQIKYKPGNCKKCICVNLYGRNKIKKINFYLLKSVWKYLAQNSLSD